MKFVTNVNSFKAGVLSKKLFGRTDIRERPEGLSIGKNAFVAKQGGGYKRGGLQSVMQFPDNQTVQVESLEVNTEKSVYLVFSQPATYPTSSYWRLYDSRGNALTDYFDIIGSVGSFSVIPYEQYFVIVNAEGTSLPTYVQLAVNNAGKVVVEEISFLEDSPYSYPQSDTNIDIDKKLRLLNVDASEGANTLESDGWNIQTKFEVGDWVMITGITYVARSPRISTGLYKILSFTNTTQATVKSFFYYSGTIGSPIDSLANFFPIILGGQMAGYGAASTTSEWFDEWSHSIWSSGRGYPKHASVDEGRLVFSSNTAKPVTLWGSRTNNPFFFLNRRLTGTDAVFVVNTTNQTTLSLKTELPYSGDILETDPYSFSLATKGATEITFMESASNFIVGTNKQEFIISGNNGALSQKNFSARPHTSHGSASELSLVFGNTVLFASRSRQQVHLFKYSQENGSFISKELTILNPDLLENDKIKEMEWHEEININFMVTDSGRLITLTANEETQTAAFTEQEIDGLVKDVAYVIRDNGNSYMSVTVQRDGGLYLDKITVEDIAVTSSNMNAIQDKITHMDNFRYLDTVNPIELDAEFSVSLLDTINDYFHSNYSELKIGDKVSFSSSESSVFTGLNISLNTDYYVIPYKDDDKIGFRIAISLADAQSNIYIDITDVGIKFFLDDLVFPNFTRDVQVIPIAQFDIGQEVTVFGRQAFGEIEELTFTADGSATYDLGIPFTEVSYGQTYDFHIATTPIEAGQQWGSAQLGIKRVDRARVRVYNTRSFRLSTDGYNSEEVILDNGDLYTGSHQMEVTGSPEFEHIVHIQNNKAEGCYISSLALRGLSNDG